VTRAASADHLGMINFHSRFEARRGMACLAQHRRLDMRRRFATGGRVFAVATGARTAGLRVVHARWLERRGDMAGLVHNRRRHVRCGFTLAVAPLWPLAQVPET
jgi:hypothetical protein